MIVMFAIPNCDTVKKARNFLNINNIEYEFVDFKKSPPTKQQISVWSDYLKELPVNKKGTTYRKYKDHFESLNTPQQIEFIIENASMIKRPILMQNDKVIAFGFDEDQYKDIFKSY